MNALKKKVVPGCLGHHLVGITGPDVDYFLMERNPRVGGPGVTADGAKAASF